MIPTAPSPLLLALLKHFEGLFKLKKDGMVYPYLCPAGIPTQGYGRVVASMEVPPITREKAEEWLVEDARARIPKALALSPGLADAQLDAITSFIFNCGSGRYKASTLRKRVNAGDWAGAAVELRKHVYGGGKKLPGLVLRREAEAQLLLYGVCALFTEAARAA